MSYLCRIFVSIFVWGHLSPEPVARLALAHLVGPFLALAEVTTKNGGPEFFDHFWSKNNPKLTKFDQAGMSNFWGLLFFRKKKRRRPPGLGTQG